MADDDFTAMTDDGASALADDGFDSTTDDGSSRSSALRHLLIGIAVAVAVLLLIIGVVQVLTPPEPVVAVVGDSITLVSAPAIDEALGDEHRVEIRAWLGMTADGMLPAVEELAKFNPQVAVVNLGTNDVLKELPLDVTIDRLGLYVDRFVDGGADCVLIVNMNTTMLAGGVTPVEERAVQLNGQIVDLASRRPGVVVVDWDAAVRTTEQSGRPSLVPDSVHPSLEGGEELARILREEMLGQCE